jgi:hypothetical protein
MTDEEIMTLVKAEKKVRDEIYWNLDMLCRWQNRLINGMIFLFMTNIGIMVSLFMMARQLNERAG